MKSVQIKEPDKIGSYAADDVIFLLKDIGQLIEEKGTEDREESIQSGVHYSEMLPIEYQPAEEYIQLFHQSLTQYAKKLAIAVAVVARRIVEKKNKNLVLVSLARAGTPIGILLKRYIKLYTNEDVPHFSISIIRDRGIDENALFYILNKYPDADIQFIDGWTGKGAITSELKKACHDFEIKHGVRLDEELAVLADPGHCVNIYGTREDFLIPSACLNSTVSGLVSRTVLNDLYVGADDFHGAKYYKDLIPQDLSNNFIETISDEFMNIAEEAELAFNEAVSTGNEIPSWKGLKDVGSIQRDFGIDNINFIKPGVGETTRVLLRRIPWKILVKNMDDPRLEHIKLLAEDRNVQIEEYKDMSYTCCGIIKPLK